MAAVAPARRTRRRPRRRTMPCPHVAPPSPPRSAAAAANAPRTAARRAAAAALAACRSGGRLRRLRPAGMFGTAAAGDDMARQRVSQVTARPTTPTIITTTALTQLHHLHPPAHRHSPPHLPADPSSSGRELVQRWAAPPSGALGRGPLCERPSGRYKDAPSGGAPRVATHAQAALPTTGPRSSQPPRSPRRRRGRRCGAGTHWSPAARRHSRRSLSPLACLSTWERLRGRSVSLHAMPRARPATATATSATAPHLLPPPPPPPRSTRCGSAARQRRAARLVRRDASRAGCLAHASFTLTPLSLCHRPELPTSVCLGWLREPSTAAR